MLNRAELYNLNRVFVINLLKGLRDCAKEDEERTYLRNMGFQFIENLAIKLGLDPQKCSFNDISTALSKIKIHKNKS